MDTKKPITEAINNAPGSIWYTVPDRTGTKEGLIMFIPWTVDYTDTGAGLPWEIRLDYLKNNGWTTSEILKLQAREAHKIEQEDREGKADGSI